MFVKFFAEFYYKLLDVKEALHFVIFLDFPGIFEIVSNLIK